MYNDYTHKVTPQYVFADAFQSGNLAIHLLMEMCPPQGGRDDHKRLHQIARNKIHLFMIKSSYDKVL